MGAAHGSTHAAEIRSYLEERVGLVMSGLWSGGPLGRAAVLDVAESMLPAHDRHSPALATEMRAMADAAGITAAEAIIVGGFTDFVDTVRARVGGRHPDSVMEDDCTSVIVPDTRADGAGFLAQTWDMHDTATEYVILLRTRPHDDPAALVFTTTGALGQLGMNELGVCVGINNLTATDGVPGVTWPQVVREALRKETAEEARDSILGADLAGGHYYLVFDDSGAGYNIEAMPSVRPVTVLDSDPIVHTNHTLTDETDAVQGYRADELQESSHRRLDLAGKLLEGFDADSAQIDVRDLMELTREPTAICQVPHDPYRVESSGAVVMRPRTREFWACWGRPADNEFQKVDFA